MLSSWCHNNKLFLNINKCKVMSFYRRISPVLFDYQINNISLERVNEMKDLGILFDTTFSFVKHIDFIVSKAYSMLGLIMRICDDFNTALVFKSLYFAHVRSVLDYAAVVWSPSYDVHIRRIESIQKKFFSFLFKKFGYYSMVQFAPYMIKCSILQIEPLSERRKNSSLLFMFDILSGRVDSSYILSQLNFRVPARQLRNSHNSFLRIRNGRTNYSSFDPISTMSTFFNEIYYIVDFNQSQSSFRYNIRRIWQHNLIEVPV